MTEIDNFNLAGIAAAIGIGLMIGLERERRQSRQPRRTPAGIRTFTLAALLGALSQSLGLPVLIMVGVLLGILVCIGYLRSTSSDAGLTTEVALITTLLLGALSMSNPTVAGALGVIVTILLASRTRLHQFVQQTVTEQEVHDGLLFAAAALVILPLTSNHAVDPFGVLNPRKLWALVVLVMGIHASGYLALRIIGPRLGLGFAGFASGFVSSSATIMAMGHRARQEPRLAHGAASGAVLSSVSTVIQLAAVTGAISAQVLGQVALPLLAAGLSAIAYGAWFAWINVRQPVDAHVPAGRAFDLRIAVLFPLVVSIVLLLSAALSQHFGSAGLLAAAAVAGLADTHSASVAVASVAVSGQIETADAVIPIMLAFTTNSVTKVVMALTAGDRAFAIRVIPGVLLMLLAAWGVVLFARFT
jgi:uncharacterized membrane protein (DUF4010 family)